MSTDNTITNANVAILFQKEDQLDLSMSPLTATVAASEIDACSVRLSIENQSVNPLVAEISLAAMNQLLTKATVLGKQTQNYVTGIKMSLAFDQGKITLVYQPLCMTRQPSSLMEPSYYPTAGDFYEYDANASLFKEITSDLAEGRMQAYRSVIRILHRTDVTFSPFIPNVDTDSIIFSFQVIFALMAENSASSVRIHNSIRLEDAGASYKVKHCLLLSVQNPVSSSFSNKFANRSHLCPPSCNTIEYALVAI